MKIDRKLHHKAIYNTLKNAVGAIAAILIANVFGLNFALSAGIIAILSLLGSRKETLRVGVKRIIAGIISLFIASALFSIIGYNLYSLAAFITLVSFLAYIANSSFSIASSLVLAGHIYGIGSLTPQIFLNEVYILLIGVAMGFVLTLHMPDDEKSLKEGIEYIEEQYKNHLIVMAHNLRNHCIIKNNAHSLDEIEKQLKELRTIAKRDNDNSLFKENAFDYYRYFEMRLEQVYRLMHMKEKMEVLFITHHEADKLSEFTQIISLRFSAHTPVNDLLELTEEYYEYFRKRPLPETREEFECRATLFQYLVEMEEFIRIKARYIKDRQ